MMSCYQSDDLGLPWRQFKILWWWKSALRHPRNVWKVAQMKDIIIRVPTQSFGEIGQKMKALASWPDDKGLSEFDGLPCRQQPAWRQDGDIRIGEDTLVCQPGQSSISRLNSSSPLPTPLTYPSPPPLLPFTSTFSTSLFSFPSPFHRWQKCSGIHADEALYLLRL